jgi:hypothetical protein
MSILDDDSGMIPFTVNEIRRLWATDTTPHHSRHYTRTWSRWRRRRQAQARRAHYQRRHQDLMSRL